MKYKEENKALFCSRSDYLMFSWNSRHFSKLSNSKRGEFIRKLADFPRWSFSLCRKMALDLDELPHDDDSSPVYLPATRLFYCKGTKTERIIEAFVPFMQAVFVIYRI